MLKWTVDNIYLTWRPLEKKPVLDIDREMHSSTKKLHDRPAVGDWQAKYKFTVAIQDIHGPSEYHTTYLDKQ